MMMIDINCAPTTQHVHFRVRNFKPLQNHDSESEILSKQMSLFLAHFCGFLADIRITLSNIWVVFMVLK